MKLCDAVTRWIDQRSINLAPSTVAGYRRLCRLYVAAVPVGARDVADLDASDMLDLLRPLLLRGCTRQAQLLQIMVAAVLKHCVRRGEIKRNPMDEVDRVKHKGRFTPWLTKDQARRLLETSAAAGDPYYLAWLLMLCCGLRRGEMLALEWTDIDFDRGLLHVERQQITIDRVTMVTRPKSQSSIREIWLDDHLLSLLRLQRRAGGRILEASAGELADALDRALIRAQLPRITLHGMRHTMAAVAAGAGVPVKVLQSIMGHAHYQTTADIYEHVDDQPRRAAASIITMGMIGTRLEIV